MKKRSWKLLAVLTAIGTCGSALFSFSIAAGFLLGSLLSVLLYKRNESYWGEILDIGTTAGSRYGFHFLVNMIIMAAPMLLAVRFPRYLNIFAAAAGLLMIKITVTIEVLLPWKGDSHEDTD